MSSFTTNLRHEFDIFCARIASSIDQWSNLVADHACYRVETQEQYELYKHEFSAIGAHLIESVVSGRPISTFRLNTPLSYLEKSIPLIELPSPKPGSPYKKGFEHLEFVIDCSFEEFVKKYPAGYDWSGTKKENNPELRLKLAQGFSVKFHHYPLDKVIEQELSS